MSAVCACLALAGTSGCEGKQAEPAGASASPDITPPDPGAKVPGAPQPPRAPTPPPEGATFVPDTVGGSIELLVADARRDGKRGLVATISQTDRRAFERLVGEVARLAFQVEDLEAGPPSLPARLQHDLLVVGFELVYAVGPDGAMTPAQRGLSHPVLCLREAPGIRRGGGIYLFRVAPTSPVVLQAPHSFFDRGTRTLAERTFATTGVAALMLNTVHRYEGGRPRKDHPSDVAHQDGSLYQAATRGLARVLPQAAFVQVHGFRAKSHPDLDGVDLVVSQGSQFGTHDPRFTRLANALRAALPDRTIATYGDEARSLGGTRNVQGRFINAYTDDVFYHLELSDGLRDALAADASLRDRLIQGAVDSLRSNP